jgi:hypothetical protein
MPTLEYSCKYKKNTDLVLSPAELRDLYLYGINLKSKDGTEMPTYVWETKIRSAQAEIEKFLAIKLIRQLITETCTYYRDDYLNNLPIINLSYPIIKAVTLLGILNGTEQISYPIEWANTYQGPDQMAPRRLSIVPSGTATSASTSVILMGVTAQIGIRSLNIVPNYWTVSYLTGFTPGAIPIEIMDVIGKLSAIQVLCVFGDLVLPPGISGSSLSIDGLSQNLSTVISGKNGAFGGRITQYLEDIKVTLQRLERSYKGINFAVL